MNKAIPAALLLISVVAVGLINLPINANAASTSTTTLASNVNPSFYGQRVTFIATVFPSNATGTVTFTIDGVAQPAVTLVSGRATLLSSTLSIGTHQISTQYSGNSNFNPSTSTALTQTVNKANTKTALFSSVNPSAYSQKVTLNAAVSNPGTGKPSGTVTFTIDGTPRAPVPMSSGIANFPVTTFSIGPHTVTARYSGDSNFNISTSSTLTQTVNKASTTTIVASSLNPALPINSVTFTAYVNNTVATGSVTFYDNATTIGTKSLSSGTATFTTPSLALGTHIITAAYSGDANFNPSNNAGIPLAQLVSTTSAPKPFLMDFFRGDVNQSSLITFFNKFTTTRDFVSPLLNAQPANYFQVHAGNATMHILSLAQADSTITQAKMNHISYMVYDLEPNNVADFANYVSSTATVANKVHAAGLKVMLEPRWLELESYGSQIAPYADYIIIQLPYPEYTLHSSYANWLAQHIPILRSSAGHPIIIGEQLLTIPISGARVNNYNPIDIEIGYNSTKNYIDFIQLFYFNATYTDNTNTTVTSDVIPYLTKFYKGIGIPGL